MKTHYFPYSVMLLLFFVTSCGVEIKHEFKINTSASSGEYLGQLPPGDTAELFAPGIMSTGLAELNAAFFPDKKEVIYSIAVVPSRPYEWRMFIMKEVNGTWTEPYVAEFSRNYSAVDPFVSYDGKRIYYCSNRPISGEGEPEDNFDIWYVDRTETGWSEPVNLGEPINSDANEFYPSMTREGTMYFQSWREGGLGRADIYRSKLKDGKYTEVELLPEPINSEGFEGDAFIAPDESYIIISADRMNMNRRSDLWISFLQADGSWTEITDLEHNINTVSSENCQMLSPCGKYLFFTSRRLAKKPDNEDISHEMLKNNLLSTGNNLYSGDIYWVDAGFIEEIKERVLNSGNDE